MEKNLCGFLKHRIFIWSMFCVNFKVPRKSPYRSWLKLWEIEYIKAQIKCFEVSKIQKWTVFEIIKVKSCPIEEPLWKETLGGIDWSFGLLTISISWTNVSRCVRTKNEQFWENQGQNLLANWRTLIKKGSWWNWLNLWDIDDISARIKCLTMRQIQKRRIFFWDNQGLKLLNWRTFIKRDFRWNGLKLWHIEDINTLIKCLTMRKVQKRTVLEIITIIITIWWIDLKFLPHIKYYKTDLFIELHNFNLLLHSS